jgi:hypothetical protein
MNEMVPAADHGTDPAGRHTSIGQELAHQASLESLAAPVHSRSIERLPERVKLPPKRPRRQFTAKHRDQDIAEVYFAGNHGDIGGGWSRRNKEHELLSHTALVWMVHEAEGAGLKFDPG